MLFPRQYDVGVDNNNYTPISFAEVEVKIQEQIAKSTRL
jgi:calcineurin-like phosphoesterase family protein